MAENMQESPEQIKPSGIMSKQSSTENMNNAGAVETNVKHNRPYSANKSGTLHWFACIGPADESARSESCEEREHRLKMLRDKQNEERQRKLEELKAQALAAQRFREMKEEERKKRIEELRLRDNDRRQQVGERKRLIHEAERDRRESILKKNMEREARFELKRRNERSSAAFAFGSSTPRMLEPADTGGSFWGHRRATSTNNIMFAAVPLTRRSSERELDGSKKRATSAGGLDRNNADGETIPAGCASGHVGRRRTDLMPTIPTRDVTGTQARKPFTKSPGPSRPDSSLSHQSTSSVSSNVNMRSRPIAAPRKPRPASIAVTGVTHDSNRNPLFEKKSETKPPLPRSRKTSVGKVAPERIPSKLSKTSPKATPKVTPLQSPCAEAPAIPPVEKPTAPVAPLVPPPLSATNPQVKEISTEKTLEAPTVPELKQEVAQSKEPAIPVVPQTQNQSQSAEHPVDKSGSSKTVPKEEPQQQIVEENALENADMTASMIAKIRITTEEEAKAALAERRRLAREEAERQAEAERQRIEAEIIAEQERQRLEEEQARLLAEQQRHAEEERLAQAIRETQKREEEEKLRREEELKQKIEKEEQEKKAREESEKQRIEMQERLKQEEKEREARRKRVEAIMLRTRASKGNAGNNQSKDENMEKIPLDENKSNVNNKPAGTIESYEKQVNEKEAALFNGSFNKSQGSVISKENGENGEPQHSNGHRNGVDTEQFSKVDKSLIENNVTNTLLDLDDLDPFKNANTSLVDIPADKITNEDSVNSNNPTESNSTTDFLL